MNIYSQVGLITLVGLISKNGILIVQFANELQRQGRTKIQAVREAAMLRLRPVLMTSVATVAGNFPLTLVTGAGAAARNSIGIMLVGRHDHRHAVHAAGDSVHLHFDRQATRRGKPNHSAMRTKTNSGGRAARSRFIGISAADIRTNAAHGLSAELDQAKRRALPMNQIPLN